jgi:hypothetical protein
MIVHDVLQGSPEWLACRLGIPTASEFDKIITAGGQTSRQAGSYADRLLAEIMVGKPVETFKGTAWTGRGNDLEPDAAAFYELQRDVETVRVGFCTDDTRTMGASPDRLIGEDGLLEIKCPAPHTHVKTLLDQNLDRDHYPQIQGQLLVTGKKWVDIISYHPEMPSLILRVERDEAYLSTMRKLLNDFQRDLQTKRGKMVVLGYMKL